MEVDRPLPRGGFRSEPRPAPARACERRDHLITDFVAASEDRRSERRHEVAGREAVRPEAGDGARGDPRRSAAPAGVHGRDRPRLRMDQQDRDTIRGPHRGDRSVVAGFAGPVGAVGLRGKLQARHGIDDRGAVNLSEDRRPRAPQPRGAEERAASGDDLRIPTVGGTKIEGGAALRPARAERVRHARDRAELDASQKLNALDLVETPARAGTLAAYFTDPRLLIVALMSAASFARGSRSTYFWNSLRAPARSPSRSMAKPRSRCARA